MKQNLVYNALALSYVVKQGGEMLADFNSLLASKGITKTASELLQLPAKEFAEMNAAMGTTEVAFGKEFVEAKILSSELIERLQNSESLLSRAVVHQMMAGTQAFPVRGTRIRMVKGSEKVTDAVGGVVATEAKRAGTAELELTAKKYICTIAYSDELLEDSVIGIAQYVQSELVSAYETSIHQVILNGDTRTGANTNINIIDGNTSALPDGNITDVLNDDGARRIALSKSATVNATTALTLAHIRSARKLMGLKGMNPADLVLVPDQDTYFSLLNLSQVETVEKFGDSATVKEGRIVAIDGIAIVNREEVPRATATGEVSATPANNTTGQMVLIHLPSLHVGVRRGLTLEESRFATEQQTAITGSARIAVKFDDTQNSIKATSPCALIRNI